MNKPTLVSIVHDPKGTLHTLFDLQITKLYACYDSIVINATSETKKSLLGLIEKKATIIVGNKSNLGDARRHALAYACNHTASNRFHYCDLNKLLHWSSLKFDELMETVLLVNNKFVIHGRSDQAMATYPLIDRVSSKLINWTFKYKTFCEPMDLLASSRLFSRSQADLILSVSRVKGAATNLEWPLLFAPRIDYCGLDGLACSGLRSTNNYKKVFNQTIDMLDYLL